MKYNSKYTLTKKDWEDEKEFSRKEFRKGNIYQIILPQNMGFPIYTSDYAAAVELKRYYGIARTKIIDLNNIFNN